MNSWWPSMTNSWWLWLIVGGVLVAGPMLLLWNWRLDRAYSDGWDRCGEKIRNRQVQRLIAGQVLMIDEHGPYWHDPGGQAGAAEEPKSLTAGGPIPPGSTQVIDMDRGVTAAPNRSKLLNDQQVRAELAKLASDEAPAATSPAAGPVPPGPVDRQTLPAKANAETASDAAPGGDLFGMLPDAEAFEVIRWEFARLKRMVAQPYRLTGWSAA